MHLHGTVRTLKVLGDSILVQQSLKKVSLTWDKSCTFKLFEMRYAARFPHAEREQTSNWFTLNVY